jgi:hypothetical protein
VSTKTHVGPGGGRASSADGSVSVSFTPAQVPTGADVTVTTGTGGSAPVHGVRPLTRPFSIDTGGRASGETVTARYAPPPGVPAPDPALLVMVISEHGGWRVLPTTVSPAGHTLTSAWPHFSNSYLGRLDASFDPVGAVESAAGSAAQAVEATAQSAEKAASSAAGAVVSGVVDVVQQAGADAVWSWDKFTQGVYALGSDVKSVAAGVVEQVWRADVAIAGGTTSAVSCDPATSDWSVTNSTGMTGCVEPKDSRGVWRMRVNDRYPYPLLVMLPKAVIGPGFSDMPPSTGLADRLLSLVASRFGREILPAGGNMPVLLRPAGDTVTLSATVDQFSLAVRSAAFVAAVYSKGETAEAEEAVAAAEQELYQKFIASRRAGDDTYGLADYIQDTQADSSGLRMREKALARAKDAKWVDILFDAVDYIDCAWGLYRDAQDSHGKVVTLFEKAAKEIADKCFLPFAQQVTKHAMGAELSTLTHPQNQMKEMVKAMVEQAKELRPVVASGFAAKLKEATGGLVDATQAGVVATASFGAGTLADTGLVRNGTDCPKPGPVAIPGAVTPVLCRWVVHPDLDGNGKPDELALWRSASGRGAVAVTDDGVVHQLAAEPQGDPLSIPSWRWATGPGLTPPDPASGPFDGAAPLEVLKTAAGRDVVGVATSWGAHGADEWLLGMDTSGSLAFVADHASRVNAYAFPGIAGSPGCLGASLVFTPPMHLSC